MKRQALPQHEVDVIVARIKKGESLSDIYRAMQLTVEESWFAVNAESLYKLAGVDPSRDAQGSLDDQLEKAIEGEEPSDPQVEAEPELVENDLTDIDREPATRGKRRK